MVEQFPLDRAAAAGTKFEPLWVTPSHWPRSVRNVPLNDFDHLGRDPRTMPLYWDGAALITEKRCSVVERRFAWAGVAIGVIGVAATVAQAIAAFMALPVH
ncbi:hypothetical protein ABIB57_004311 [Devosia sp. UYZn731]|uniref:hypothetical protein n=1 Tax=Devosia sp. UYZn731 TaxID=3156345 RepID=UPI003390C2C2